MKLIQLIPLTVFTFFLINHFLNKFNFLLDSKKSSLHKVFIDKTTKPPFSGGIIILFSLLILMPNNEINFKIIIFLIFMTGFLSDIGILKSANLRFIVQIILVLFSVIILEKYIQTVRWNLIDNFLAFDKSSKVACETLVTTGQVVLAGEVKSKTYLDVQQIARDVINKIGYTKSEYMFDGSSCGVFSAIHEQSPDINQGVDKANKEEQGAGDQGMMFGYATDETEN